MIKPAYLKEGDKIGIVSTARKISKEELKPCIEHLKSWGLKVILGKHIYDIENQMAGTDEARAEDMQTMLDDPNIRAIMCARGGYGTVRIIDKLYFSSFKKSPKWIIGFSDVTALHTSIHNRGYETIHGAMAINFYKDKDPRMAISTLRKALFNAPLAHTADAHPMNRKGKAKGQVVGGNLSIIYSMMGSESQMRTDGKILFLEDLDEYMYHIDRMIMNLKRSGMLNKISGLVVGGMTDMNDNAIAFGRNVQEIILDAVKNYDYPVCFDFPAGHIDDNRALIMGAEAELIVDDKVELIF
ncbi:MAG: LD-carboxypeptidase [Flavobacteriales bacterium]|nr:LD-carboxypeptidase [Flavobacteriales bacterium]